MPTGQRRRPWWKPALAVVFFVVGLVSLAFGITSADWLKIAGGHYS